MRPRYRRRAALAVAADAGPRYHRHRWTRVPFDFIIHTHTRDIVCLFVCMCECLCVYSALRSAHAQDTARARCTMQCAVAVVVYNVITLVYNIIIIIIIDACKTAIRARKLLPRRCPPVRGRSLAHARTAVRTAQSSLGRVRGSCIITMQSNRDKSKLRGGGA